MTMKTPSFRHLLVAQATMFTFAASFATPIEIGWSEADITPPPTKRIPLCGQYYQRLADTNAPYHSRIKFVASALKNGGEYVLMGGIDNVTTWQPFVDRVRARVHELAPEIAPEHIFMGCIHTHSAPAIRPSGTPRAAEMERISRLMDQDRLYLRSDLKVQDVAVALQTNSSYVSECINSLRGQSFSQFVNTCRVRHAQELLRRQPDLKTTIVATESGFSTEASFFRNFKAVTGMTPREWLTTLSEA